MAVPKMHLLKGKTEYGAYVGMCGRNVRSNAVTCVKSEVTCGPCLERANYVEPTNVLNKQGNYHA